MIVFRYGTNDYSITVNYKGETLTYRLFCYNSNPDLTSWFIAGKKSMQELSWNKYRKELKQVLLDGQQPLPPDFMHLLQQEFVEYFAEKDLL